MKLATHLQKSLLYMWHHMKVELQASKRSHVADKLSALSKQYSDHMCSLAFSRMTVLKWFVAHFSTTGVLSQFCSARHLNELLWPRSLWLNWPSLGGPLNSVTSYIV